MIPSIRTHDTSVNMTWEYKPAWRWQDVLKEPAGQALVAIVKLLRSLGWKVRKDKEVPASIRNGFRIARKGSLFCYIDQGGRCCKVEAFTEYNRKNQNGGRYDFDKLEKMSYLDRMRWVTVRSKIIALFPGAIVTSSDERFIGIEWIQSRREEGCHAHVITPGESNQPPYNRKASDGTLLVDAQPVNFFRCGRIQSGIAFHNINNMWWVLLPSGEIRNIASFDLFPIGSVEVRRGRYGEDHARTRIRKLQCLLKSAKEKDEFEQAIVYRDLLKGGINEKSQERDL